jgi:hypothetical protein|tara:strand:- start:211 stop:480 length:270 start_codon:yes stop_codon:yes gene_type:complete
MDEIQRQFSRVKIAAAPVSNKNPNRVAGGIKGSGTDMVTVVDESGQERHIPTKKYITALEDQIRLERNRISSMETKLNRLSRDFSGSGR